MTERVDAVVIGAGVVGLAVSRALALAGREVILLEQHGSFGTETSSRNSEVIHAGIYYEPGSLKARLCVAGKARLYAYLRERSLPHLNCGKLIVATRDEEVPALEALKANAEANGVTDLTLMGAEEALALEPGLSCVAALHSPSTGIFDSHAYMLSLLGDLEAAGGMVVFRTPMTSARLAGNGVVIETGGAEPMTVAAGLLVNCAGLHAGRIAEAIEGFPREAIPAIRYAKGVYFAYEGRAPFERLIYPMPTPDSQGTHYTRDLSGQGRLGPDIRWDATLGDYDVEPERRDAFWQAARTFWPDLNKQKLHAAYAGLRPKLSNPGEFADFRIDGPARHGVPGVINLFGIESPGLTANMAIGEFVAKMAGADPATA